MSNSSTSVHQIHFPENSDVSNDDGPSAGGDSTYESVQTPKRQSVDQASGQDSFVELAPQEGSRIDFIDKDASMETCEEIILNAATLIDTANVPILGVDMTGKITVWNKIAANISGYTSEDTMGHHFVQEFITDDFRASVQEVLDRATRGFDGSIFGFPLVTKDGRQIEILMNATSRRDGAGHVIGVVGVGHEVSARLVDEKGYSRWLIETANAPIIGVDVGGNETANTFPVVGFTGKDTLGQPFVTDFVTKDLTASVHIVLDEALRGEERENFQLAVLTKSGHRVEIQLNATSCTDADGRVIDMVGISQDMPECIAQESYFTRVVDASNAPIFSVDTRGNVTEWNKCAANIWGYTSEEAMGHQLVQEFITVEFSKSMQKVIDNALRGEETANFQVLLLTKQGTRVEILLNATSRRDAEGRIIGMLGVGQDITARIAQEQEYARVIETANAPIFGVDLMGKVTLWNKCSADVTSFYSAEVMGRQLVQQFICEDFRVLAQEVIDKALRGEETANFEFSIITKTQTKVHILLNATPQRNKFGHVIGMVSIGQDITARIVHAEEYSKLIDTANALIFCVDISGKVTVWNKCAANISGYTSEDTMGHNFVQEFITEAFRASVQGVLDKALRGPVDSNFDFPLVTKDGRRIEISLNATSRRDENGRIVGVVGIGQDITDARARHEAEMRQREAEAAQSAQSTILAHVYHEIRNVVSTVLALAERASEAVDLALEDASGELLKKLPDTVRHLTEHQSLVWAHAVNTLNDMLDVARMENGTYMPSSMLIDLGALCSKAAKLQGPRLKSGVQLHLDCPSPGALIVLSDPSLLLQYLTNLLSNAAKFTESGHVMITCRSSPHATQKGWVNVILGVADTGPGIHPSDQERVLQAFTTGNVVPTEDVGVSVRSTGIGLRLSNLIAGILGGVDPAGGSNCEKDVRGVNADRMKSEKLDVKKSIHITSPLPSRLSAKMTGGGGPGTYLAITASMEIASKESIRKETIAANVNGPSLDDHSFTLEPSGNLRVLVVDDQRTMRQMVCTLFQHVCMEHPDMRVEITTALSGDEAVRVSRQKHFHVITMDQTLSAGYCKTVQAMQGSLRAERRAQGGASDDTPGSFDDIAMLNVDADRMQTSKRRTEFFKDELMHHMVLDGDGDMDGHVAMRTILEMYSVAGRRDAPIIFNLTGNTMEVDHEKYMSAGSSGVLQKPAKPQDLVDMLEDRLSTFLANGTLVSDAHGFVTTPDSTFCFSRLKSSCFDDVDIIPVFVLGLTAATSVANAVSKDAAQELRETLSRINDARPLGSGAS